MVWLIGNRGMLGQDVVELLQQHEISYYASDKEIDITNFETIKEFVQDKDIKWVINCSSYTAVDQAEDEFDLALKVNGDGVKNLALISKQLNATLVHFSTDYVFDGMKVSAYEEFDQTNPLTAYGKSKLAGEDYIRQVWHKHFIFRISWLYGKNGNNFVFTMLRLFKEQDVVRVVDDQFGTPTYTMDVAKMLLYFIINKINQYGVYHFSNEGRTSWYKFCQQIYEQVKAIGMLDTEATILGINTDEYPTKAKRPANSYMSKEKIKKIYNFIPDWQQALSKFFHEIKD